MKLTDGYRSEWSAHNVMYAPLANGGTVAYLRIPPGVVLPFKQAHMSAISDWSWNSKFETKRVSFHKILRTTSGGPINEGNVEWFEFNHAVPGPSQPEPAKFLWKSMLDDGIDRIEYWTNRTEIQDEYQLSLNSILGTMKDPRWPPDIVMSTIVHQMQRIALSSFVIIELDQEIRNETSISHIAVPEAFALCPPLVESYWKQPSASRSEIERMLPYYRHPYNIVVAEKWWRQMDCDDLSFICEELNFENHGRYQPMSGVVTYLRSTVDTRRPLDSPVNLYRWW